MDIGAAVISGLWAALFAGAVAIIFTVPRAGLPIAVAAGFAGRFTRDLLTSAGLSLVAAAFVAALAISLIALVFAPRHHMKPVVAMSAFIPIGASVAAFGVVDKALRIASQPNDPQLPRIAAALVADLTTLISVTFAIALAFTVAWSIAYRRRLP
jgi:uncharacterized membrane protein YjjB (DUF3815 family)